MPNISNEIIDWVTQLHEDQPHLSLRQIASIVDVNFTSVRRILQGKVGHTHPNDKPPRHLHNPIRCPTCRGLIFLLPCVVCTTRQTP